MDIRAQAQFLFEKYNDYMTRVGEDYFSRVSATRDVYTDEFEREVAAYTDAESEAFFGKPLAGFPFDTPAGFFASLQTLDDCLAVFSVAAEVSDVEPPRALTDRLAGFGQEATDRLLEMALAESWERDSDDASTGQKAIPAPVPAAIRLLGRWREKDSIEPILRHFCSAKSPDEYMADVIADYAEEMGEMAVPELRRILDEAGSIPAGSAEESILVALSKAGAKHRTDENYDILRAAFRKTERKVIGALCLGDYGDSRAIALLKGYLDRNGHALDRETFYESMSVIQKLGGDISDINDPFGDFRRN
ncbi:MAG: hypothetical protein PHP22_04145 [Oscillospiraceae bacterium]|jgi:hypothetical protein|nr:hypothetical protein [Oscillospiraceae bacterium]